MDDELIKCTYCDIDEFNDNHIPLKEFNPDTSIGLALCCGGRARFEGIINGEKKERNMRLIIHFFTSKSRC